MSPKDSQHYQLVLQCGRTERDGEIFEGWCLMEGNLAVESIAIEGSHAGLVGLDRSPQE